jgi:hypothetical protein
MTRRSRRNIKGGDTIDDLQMQSAAANSAILRELDDIKKQLNDIKNSCNSVVTSKSVDEPIMSEPTSMEEPMSSEPESVPELVSVNKTWVDDKNTKFRDGSGGRVSLSFSRIMTLLDNNLKKGDAKKDWSTIKSMLMAANSTDEVQNIIDKYTLSFSSNYVAGTRRKRKYKGGKKSHKRR